MSFGEENDRKASEAWEHGVVLVDRSHWGRLRVAGSGQLDFLHGQTTADINSLQPGEGCQAVCSLPPALACNHHAHMQPCRRHMCPGRAPHRLCTPTVSLQHLDTAGEVAQADATRLTLRACGWHMRPLVAVLPESAVAGWCAGVHDAEGPHGGCGGSALPGPGLHARRVAWHGCTAAGAAGQAHLPHGRRHRH